MPAAFRAEIVPVAVIPRLAIDALVAGCAIGGSCRNAHLRVYPPEGVR